MMFTTDLALGMDRVYAEIPRRFYENRKAFAEAFARAWYKLTHSFFTQQRLGAQAP